MTTPKTYEQMIDDAKTEYAAGNGTSYCPEICLENAFIAGADWSNERAAVLVEALESCNKGQFQGEALHAQVRKIGDWFGYGALMEAASYEWRKKLENDNIDGGEFSVGPCVLTVEHTLAAYRGKE